MTSSDASFVRSIPVVRHDSRLDPFEGEWVLVHPSDGVVAHAESSSLLLQSLPPLDRDYLRRCVMQYVFPPSKSIQVW